MDLNNMQRGGLKNLQNHRTGLDKDAIWADMNQKKKRRPFFWLWFGAFAFLIGIVGIYFLSDFGKSTPITKVSSVEKINQEIANSNNNIVDQIETAIPNSTSETSLIQNKEVVKTSTSLVKSEVTKETDFSNSNLKTEAKSTTVFKNQKAPINLNIEKRQSQFASTKGNFHRPLKTNQLPLLSTKKENFEEQFEIDLLPIRLAALELESIIKLESPSLKEVKPIKRQTQTNGFSIDIYTGIGTHFKQLEMKNAFVTDEYFNFRREEIKSLESYAFGIGLTKRMNNKWSIGSGVEIAIYQESISYKGTKVENTGTFDPNLLPIGSNQNTFLVTKENSTYYNEFYQLNAPIILGYKIKSGKIRMETKLGVVLNWNYASNGEFKNEEDTLTNLAPFYKKGLGLSYRFGWNFGYALGNQTILSLNPKFDWNPNEWTTSQNVISEKRNAIGLDLGISKGF